MSQLARSIIEKGVEKLLDEAKIPLRQHLQIVKGLRDRLATHDADRKAHQRLMLKSAEELGAHKKDRKEFLAQLADYDKEVERLHTLPHIKGEKGDKGEDANVEQIISRVLEQIPMPQDGKDADEEAIIEAVLQRIPQPQDGKDAAFDEETFIKRLVEYLRKNQVLDISHIRNAQSFMRDGIRYRIEEMMHGGGAFSSTSIITVSGTVNDTNTSFTATRQPVLLNINGAFYQQTGGAITWTYSGGTITLSAAVGTGGSIFGI